MKLSRTTIALVALVIALAVTSCELVGAPGQKTATTAAAPPTTAATTTTTTIQDSITVPKLVGRFFFHGKRILEIYGLQYENLSKGIKGANSRRIASQDPKAGTQVPEGYVVTLKLLPAPPLGGRSLTDLGAATDGLLPKGDSSDDASKSEDDSGGSTDTTAGDGGDATTTTEGGSTGTTGGSSTPTTSPSGKTTKRAVLTVVDEIRHPRSSSVYDARTDLMIKNTGNATAYCSTVQVNYFAVSSTGARQVFRAEQRMAPSVIKSGNHGYVSVNIGDADQDEEIEATTSFVDDPAACSTTQLDVDSKSIVTAPEGNPAVSGSISGASGTLFTLAYVGAAAFDSDDDLLEVAMVEIDPLLLALGSTSYLIDLEYADDVSYVKAFAEGVR